MPHNKFQCILPLIAHEFLFRSGLRTSKGASWCVTAGRIEWSVDYIDPFFCSSCGRSYSAKCSLSRHQRFECDVIPQFVCTLCTKKFKHRHHLLRHITFYHKYQGSDIYSLVVKTKKTVKIICSMAPTAHYRSSFRKLNIMVVPSLHSSSCNVLCTSVTSIVDTSNMIGTLNTVSEIIMICFHSTVSIKTIQKYFTKKSVTLFSFIPHCMWVLHNEKFIRKTKEFLLELSL
ncbi:uncharacterized protein LOC126252677 [Schistocerca nitens]|uniref:uncharacterized protein LOC126252677 n=1 Tax=Schistocerca nitens TaxID=7011 RepID=UPI002118CC3A|nr:uncharacterized protein LOC126252677 [Schistocerca nitens]